MMKSQIVIDASIAVLTMILFALKGAEHGWAGYERIELEESED